MFVCVVLRDIMLRHLSKMHNVNGVQSRPEVARARTGTPARNPALPAGGRLMGGGVIVPRPSVPIIASPREDRQELQTIVARDPERPDYIDQLARNVVSPAPVEESSVEPWWLSEDLDWDSFDTFLFDAGKGEGPWFQRVDSQQTSSAPSNHLEIRNLPHAEHDAVRKAWFTYIESSDTNAVQNVHTQQETVSNASSQRKLEGSSANTIGQRSIVEQTTTPLPSTSFLVSAVNAPKINMLTTALEPVHTSLFHALCLAFPRHSYRHIQTMSREFVPINHNLHHW